MEQAMLDSTQVATLLNISVKTLDDWSYRGLGPKYYKVGRRRRYKPAEVEAWLESMAVG